MYFMIDNDWNEASKRPFIIQQSNATDRIIRVKQGYYHNDKKRYIDDMINCAKN